MNGRRKKPIIPIVIILVLLLILGGGVYVFLSLNGITFPSLDNDSGPKVEVKRIYSDIDYNKNGIDDYSDIVKGARIDAENLPKYDGKFYTKGGYPPDNIGVCTDLVWRAFKEAGYSLKDMVDKDIALRPKDYKRITQPDPNIDFRRVKNLRVFFDKYAKSLTTDKKKVDEWQPGDIVIFKNDNHIGIISDKRVRNGRPYLLHNNGQKICREEDYLNSRAIGAHYRFISSDVPDNILTSWEDRKK